VTSEIIVSIITSSVLASVVTGVLVPYTKWGIEKKRIRLDNRKQLISGVRNALIQSGFSKSWFIRTVGYNRIRPYISKELDKKIRSQGSMEVEISEDGSVATSGEDLIKDQIFQELNKIEEKWGLI